MITEYDAPPLPAELGSLDETFLPICGPAVLIPRSSSPALAMRRTTQIAGFVSRMGPTYAHYSPAVWRSDT